MKLAQGFDDIIFQEKMQPCLYIIRQFCESASNYAPIDICKKKHFNASLLKWADVSMSGL